MRAFCTVLFACLTGMAQTPPQAPPQLPNVPDDEVIATFDDGVSLTAGEFKHIIAVLPNESQPVAIRDPKTFLHQWALMRKLTQLALTEKLDQQSPTREKAEYYRMMTLSEAAMLDAEHHVSVSPAEAQEYYNAHRGNYEDVRVKAIYIAFTGEAASSLGGGSKSRTEEQAKALADKIEAELKGGADFVKLVEQYSEEPVSKAKNGDFGTFHGSDHIQESTRAMVMALKPGQVSQPIRQPNGIYIFRAEEVSYQTFEEVQTEILKQLHTERYTGWLDHISNGTKVEFKSPAFFGAAPADPKPSGAH